MSAGEKVCANPSRVIVCRHVFAGSPAEVLLVSEEDGLPSHAVCFSCGDLIEANNPVVETLLSSVCLDCGVTLGVDVTPREPGFWQRQEDGSYWHQPNGEVN